MPCWVSEMSDEDAFMQLVLSNAQSELSPIEIGVHALEAVEMGVGGRGRKGGLGEYARQIGKDKGYVSELKSAAEVLVVIKQTVGSSQQFLDKAKHLSAIHKADSSLWPLLVESMLGKGWSVTDTERWVNGSHCL